MARAIFISGPPGAGKSASAAALGTLLGTPVVEVDDVKIAWYGTPARCDDVDAVFSEAGRRANLGLKSSQEVIVVEGFADEAHVDLVRAMLPKDVEELHFFLCCDPPIAVEQKVTTSTRQQSSRSSVVIRETTRRVIASTPRTWLWMK